MDVEPHLIAEPDANEADSLVSSNDPDDMANEQTWPTEEEMNGAPDDVQNPIPDAPKGTTPRIIKRIPKGMSEYQAAWIVDETDDEDDRKDENGSDGEMREEEGEEEEMVDLVIDEDKDMDTDRRDVDYEDLDLEEEERQCVPRMKPLPFSVILMRIY
jgi:pre-rRNA-processing protein TSR1